MTEASPSGPESRLDPASSWRWLLRSLPPWTGALAALIILMAVTAILQPTFLRPTNLVNIVHSNAEMGIIAVGMTVVIISAGIDLSVGSLMALAGGLGILTLRVIYVGPAESESGVAEREMLAVAMALMVTVAVATAGGTLNGMIIAWGRVAPFIATLAALVAYRSAATWIANGGQYFSPGSDLFGMLGRGIPIPGTNIAPAGALREVPFQVPYSVLVLAGVSVAGWVLLNMTRYGRHVFAVGSNERAAKYSAIHVDGVKVLTYAFIGLTVGFAAVVHATRFESVNSSNSGVLIELYVIAAVVLGGTRMEGGSGSIVGTIIGVLLIGVIRNMLTMLDVTSHAHGLVMGLIIIVAVLVQQIGRRRA